MINAQKAQELLVCNADGILVWRVDASIRARAGSMAGSRCKNGYARVKLNGKSYYAHRLVWLLAHGVWPTGEIDHINGRRDDNRLSNLRDVSSSVNHQNLKRANATSKTGLLGAHKEGDRYAARIRTPHGRLRLGYFNTPELAHAAYIAAKRQLHAGNTL